MATHQELLRHAMNLFRELPRYLQRKVEEEEEDQASGGEGPHEHDDKGWDE